MVNLQHSIVNFALPPFFVTLSEIRQYQSSNSALATAKVFAQSVDITLKARTVRYDFNLLKLYLILEIADRIQLS